MQPYLRVKIKSLAAEARIIRHEEVKYKPRIKDDNQTYFALRYHRLAIRGDTRSALLAYGILRGRTYRQIEAKCYEPPKLAQVRDNLVRFGNMSKEAASKLVTEWIEATPAEQQAA